MPQLPITALSRATKLSKVLVLGMVALTPVAKFHIWIITTLWEQIGECRDCEGRPERITGRGGRRGVAVTLTVVDIFMRHADGSTGIGIVTGTCDGGGNTIVRAQDGGVIANTIDIRLRLQALSVALSGHELRQPKPHHHHRLADATSMRCLAGR